MLKECKSENNTNKTETASESTNASDSEDSDLSGPTENSDEDRVIKIKCLQKQTKGVQLS